MPLLPAFTAACYVPSELQINFLIAFALVALEALGTFGAHFFLADFDCTDVMVLCTTLYAITQTGGGFKAANSNLAPHNDKASNSLASCIVAFSLVFKCDLLSCCLLLSAACCLLFCCLLCLYCGFPHFCYDCCCLLVLYCGFLHFC